MWKDARAPSWSRRGIEFQIYGWPPVTLPPLVVKKLTIHKVNYQATIKNPYTLIQIRPTGLMLGWHAF
jgi:hypothetical protein